MAPHKPGKQCVFGHLGIVFIWSCFVCLLLFLLFYVISAPATGEAAQSMGFGPLDSSSFLLFIIHFFCSGDPAHAQDFFTKGRQT